MLSSSNRCQGKNGAGRRVAHRKNQFLPRHLYDVLANLRGTLPSAPQEKLNPYRVTEIHFQLHCEVQFKFACLRQNSSVSAVLLIWGSTAIIVVNAWLLQSAMYPGLVISSRRVTEGQPVVWRATNTPIATGIRFWLPWANTVQEVELCYKDVPPDRDLVYSNPRFPRFN